jgi:uncharacterized protein
VESEAVTDAEPTLRIEDDPSARRYRVWLGDEFAAYSEYENEPGRIVFTHTVVRPKFEGRGIGTRLAKYAVNDARARGLRITPVCPFIRSWLERHDEYDPIVDLPPAD